MKATPRPARQIALLRGINVGTAKRITMGDLREVLVGLGCSDVRTVLASGNVVFTAPDGAADVGADIRRAVSAATGVDARVLVITAEELTAIAAANPLLEVITDPSRFVVTFTGRIPAGLRVPEPEEIAPDRIAVGERAVYQWCPDGILASRVPPSFWREFGTDLTARNWRTVQKLVALAP